MNGLCRTKPQSKAAQIREKYREGSSVFVNSEYDVRGLSRISIELHGPLSRIPSLKNSKVPGFNFMANDVRQRLRVMDEEYDRAIGPYEKPSFLTGDIAVFIICGHRPNRFDKDNCVATIQDWFEPSAKAIGKRNKKPRGWGIGLVNNDRQITSFAFYDKQFGKKLPYSLIVAVRWDKISTALLGFAESSFLL